MLLIHCPYCEEERPELEFRNAGEAHIARPGNIAEISDEEFEQFFFIRSNPKGIVYERWRHIHGCGRFFNAVRDSVSDRFFVTYKAGERKPDPARFARRTEAAQVAQAAPAADAAKTEPPRPAPPKPAREQAKVSKQAARAPKKAEAPPGTATEAKPAESPPVEAEAQPEPKPAAPRARKSSKKGDA